MQWGSGTIELAAKWQEADKVAQQPPPANTLLCCAALRCGLQGAEEGQVPANGAADTGNPLATVLAGWHGGRVGGLPWQQIQVLPWQQHYLPLAADYAGPAAAAAGLLLSSWPAAAAAAPVHAQQLCESEMHRKLKAWLGTHPARDALCIP